MAFRFMLDTNVISDVIRDPLGKVAKQLELEGELECVYQYYSGFRPKVRST